MTIHSLKPFVPNPTRGVSVRTIQDHAQAMMADALSVAPDPDTKMPLSDVLARVQLPATRAFLEKQIADDPGLAKSSFTPAWVAKWIGDAARSLVAADAPAREHRRDGTVAFPTVSKPGDDLTKDAFISQEEVFRSEDHGQSQLYTNREALVVFNYLTDVAKPKP